MFKNAAAFALSALLVVQICRADSFDDAESALADLKKATVDALNAAFMEHTTMAVSIDAAALDAKDTETADEDLEKCVNDEALRAIDMLYVNSMGLVDRTFKTIYDQEKEIVFCGKSDTECLDGVAADIQSKSSGVADDINADVEADKTEIEAQVEAITACSTPAA